MYRHRCKNLPLSRRTVAELFTADLIVSGAESVIYNVGYTAQGEKSVNSNVGYGKMESADRRRWREMGEGRGGGWGREGGDGQKKMSSLASKTLWWMDILMEC